MGCCASVEESDSVGKMRNEEIDGQLRMEKLNSKNEVKMLLLGKIKNLIKISDKILIIKIGAGESGKSTLLKQMKLIYDGGFTNEEKEAYKEIIYNNSVQSIQVLLEAMENLGISLADSNNQQYYDVIMERNQLDHFSMTTEVTSAIKNLWKDEGVKETHRRSNEFQLNDSAP